MFEPQAIHRALSASVWMFFAVCLALPSGYSYGAVAILLVALCAAPQWLRGAWDRRTLVLLCMVLGMGLLWGMSREHAQGWRWSGSDYWPKYWLAALCLAAAAHHGVALRAVVWGLAAGCWGALGIAAYQYMALGWDKAWGFTNAIQYGGIAMYLGLATWCMALLSGQPPRQTWALWLSGAAGVLASLLSETRGAWVVAPCMLAFLIVVLLRLGQVRLAVQLCVLSVAMAAMAWWPWGDKFSARAMLAVQEMQQYMHAPIQGAETSIGQRLEQWQLALGLALEQPWLGWGLEGFAAAKQRWVEAGWAHPSVLNYGHAHNEVLDMWAKRGTWGVVSLLLFYVLPWSIFVPTRARLQGWPLALQKQLLGLRMAAAMLPLAYWGFGWTQVFFAHNSGNMFYLFSLVAFWGALRHWERTHAALRSPAVV